MKILTYKNDNGFDFKKVFINVSDLNSIGIKRKIEKIKENHKNKSPFVMQSKCRDFEVLEVRNASELINLVGFNNAISFDSRIINYLSKFVV